MNVALVGAGLQGRRRAAALRPGDRLVAVADIDLPAAESLAREHGCAASASWQEAVAASAAEAVLVCTPPHLHAAISVAAMEGGRHVLCEKPLGRTPAEAQAIVEAAAGNGVKLKCGFNHRYFPAIRQAKAWCCEGAIGELLFVRCRYGIGGRPGYETEWRAQPELSGGGELMDQGLHALDLARWFLGDFREAFGYTTRSFWQVEAEDNAFVMLRTAERRVASLHVSWTQWKNLFSFEVFGKLGAIEVSGLGGSYGTQKASLVPNLPGAPFQEETIEYRGKDPSWQEEWQDFADAIETGREPLASGADGLAALRLAHAVYTSGRAGALVRVDNP